MKTNIFSGIKDKSDYLTVFDAVTGVKTSYTEEEQAKLLAIYTENAKIQLGFDADTLVKAVLALDVPAVNLLGKADADAITALSALCADWEPNVERSGAVKAAALNGTVSQPLALALARAALDAYAGQNDLTKYREEIKALSEFLKQADEEMFSDACAFLIRVRERVR